MYLKTFLIIMYCMYIFTPFYFHPLCPSSSVGKFKTVGENFSLVQFSWTRTRLCLNKFKSGQNSNNTRQKWTCKQYILVWTYMSIEAHVSEICIFLQWWALHICLKDMKNWKYFASNLLKSWLAGSTLKKDV